VALWTFVIQEQPPFEQDQKVTLLGYKGGIRGSLARLDKPDAKVAGTVVASTDAPLVKFCGDRKYFPPFLDRQNNVLLACLLEV